MLPPRLLLAVTDINHPAVNIVPTDDGGYCSVKVLNGLHLKLSKLASSQNATILHWLSISLYNRSHLVGRCRENSAHNFVISVRSTHALYHRQCCMS